MKQFIYIAIAALGFGLIAAAACTDLTETVHNEITEENFNPGPEDLAAIIAPVYSAARGKFGNRDYFWSQEETADAMVSPVRPNGWYDGGEYWRMHTHTWNSNQSQNNNPWGSSFNGINSANRVIHQIETDLVPIADDDERQAIIAELRAARAFYYALLMDTHGRPPIVTTFDDEVPEQAEREEVFDFVVSELEEVISLLREEVNLEMYGRFNKWAAKAVLVRVFLNAEVYTGVPHWDKVIEYADKIIDSGHYTLAAEYSANFNRENMTSPEIIFAIPFDSQRGTGFQVKLKSLKPGLQQVFNTATGFWGGASSAPQFTNTYHEADTRKDDTWLRGEFRTATGELMYNFIYNVPDVLGETEMGVSFEYGYPVGKYEIYEGMQGSSDVDFPWYRYAFILMAKAEALLRTGSADEAAALVTQVRERAFEDPADAIVTGAELQQGSSFSYGWWDGVNERVVDGPGNDMVIENGGADIPYGRMLDEWGWEFAAEAKRRTQLIRFGVFHTKMWLNHLPTDETRTIYPIPQGALDNNPNLTQNPGY